MPNTPTGSQSQVRHASLISNYTHRVYAGLITASLFHTFIPHRGGRYTHSVGAVFSSRYVRGNGSPPHDSFTGSEGHVEYRTHVQGNLQVSSKQLLREEFKQHV